MNTKAKILKAEHYASRAVVAANQFADHQQTADMNNALALIATVRKHVCASVPFYDSKGDDSPDLEYLKGISLYDVLAEAGFLNN